MLHTGFLRNIRSINAKLRHNFGKNRPAGTEIPTSAFTTISEFSLDPGEYAIQGTCRIMGSGTDIMKGLLIADNNEVYSANTRISRAEEYFETSALINITTKSNVALQAYQESGSNKQVDTIRFNYIKLG